MKPLNLEDLTDIKKGIQPEAETLTKPVSSNPSYSRTSNAQIKSKLLRTIVSHPPIKQNKILNKITPELVGGKEVVVYICESDCSLYGYIENVDNFDMTQYPVGVSELRDAFVSWTNERGIKANEERLYEQKIYALFFDLEHKKDLSTIRLNLP